VRVHYNEGVAIRIGPEPCAGIHEDVGEASVGERTGQPLSRERVFLPDADVVLSTEGNTDGCVIASIRLIRRGRRPWHARTLLVREPGDLRVGHPLLGAGGPRREGEEP
jgi:hypothetical protein